MANEQNTMHSGNEPQAFVDHPTLLAMATTYITKMGENNPGDDDDDAAESRLVARVLLDAETAGTADNGERTLLARATLTTNTAAVGDQENDPDDDVQLAAYRAMVTTLTESSGDNESDPDDDYRSLLGPRGVAGDRRPFAYRFAETAEPQQAPLLQYDCDLQLHVLSNGTPIIDAIRRTVATTS